MAPDAFVKTVGPPVGTGDDDGLFASVTGIALLHLFEELPAVYRPEVGIGHLEEGRLRDARLQHAPHHGGVEQDARIVALAHHFVQRAVLHRTVCCHEIGVERRTAVVSYWRQLGIVAHEEDAAACTLPDISEEVVEQRATSEGRARIGGGGEHGGFVDDETGILFAIEVEREPRFGVCRTFLPVDFLVYRGGAESRMARHDFRRPSGRGEHYGFYPQLFKCRHERRDDGRLARSCISVEDEDAFGIGIGKP